MRDECGAGQMGTDSFPGEQTLIEWVDCVPLHEIQQHSVLHPALCAQNIFMQNVNTGCLAGLNIIICPGFYESELSSVDCCPRAYYNSCLAALDTFIIDSSTNRKYFIHKN